MWATDSLTRSACPEPWITISAPYHFSSVLINFVRNINSSQIWQAKQRRHICIISEETSTISVNLISIYFAKYWVVKYSMFLNAFVYFVSK